MIAQLIDELERKYAGAKEQAAVQLGQAGLKLDFVERIFDDFKAFAIKNCASYTNMLRHFPDKKEDLDFRFAERWREELGRSIRCQLPAWVGFMARAYEQRIKDDLASLSLWPAALNEYGFLRLLAEGSMF